MKIDRAIVACDDNPLYTEFWPVVAESWSLLNIKPTLFLISDNQQVDESLGDVIRISPLEGIPTSFQAQCVRMLGPTMFPDETSIMSDIDMMPLNKKYFVDNIKDIPSEDFVIFSSDAYEKQPDFPCYPMCYNAAKGSIYKEIFKYDMSEYKEAMEDWHSLGHGWTTDERVLYSRFTEWQQNNNNFKLLRRGWVPFATGRVDRAYMKFEPGFMLLDKYIDFHMVRPYNEHKETIDNIFEWFKTMVINE
jgi:hypothetical protein